MFIGMVDFYNRLWDARDMRTENWALMSRWKFAIILFVIMFKLIYGRIKSIYVININMAFNLCYFPTSPVIPTATSIAYLIAILFVGPRLMENRKAFELKNTLLVYNLIQVMNWNFLVLTSLELYYTKIS